MSNSLEIIPLEYRDKNQRRKELALGTTGFRIRDEGAAIDSVGFEYEAIPELIEKLKGLLARRVE
jgi:hypothetical protein